MHGPNKQALGKGRLPDDYQEHRGKLMLGATKNVEHLRCISYRRMGGRLRVRMPVPDVVQPLFKESQDVGLLRSPVWPEPKPRSPRPSSGHCCVLDAVDASVYASEELPAKLTTDAGRLSMTGKLRKAAVMKLKTEVAVRIVQAAPERKLDHELEPTVIAVRVQASEPSRMKGQAIVPKLIRTSYPNSVYCPRYPTVKGVKRQLTRKCNAGQGTE